MHRILSPGELLDPRHEVVPFHGREDELAALTRWRDGDGTRSALLLHGPAGVGKTRLARRFAADGGVRVVDDADLVPWLDLHHRLRQAANGHTRVLLVARSTGWWWSAARQRAGDLGYDTADLELTARPVEQRESFASACEHFAVALGRPWGAATTPPAATTFHDLHLAAVAAVHGAPAADPADLVHWLISVDPFPPTRGRLAEDVLAVTLLDERIDLDPTPEALETLLRAADRWPHARRRAEELFTARPDLAATATAATLRALAELEPAARAVARHVFDDPRFHGDPLPAVLTRTLLYDRARTAGKVGLAELYGMLGARAALAGLREEALESARHEVALYRELAAEDPVEYRSALADALGDLGLRLVAVARAEEALAVSEEAAALCRVVATEDRDCVPQLAGALDRLSRCRAALGHGQEAMAAIREACTLYEELAGLNAALFGRELAKVTHHHAVRLFDAELRDEGTRVARLAVGHWRAVVRRDPSCEAEFARALASIASLLSAFGRRDEAADVVEESVAVLRELAHHPA